jgi:hypothetical protein
VVTQRIDRFPGKPGLCGCVCVETRSKFTTKKKHREANTPVDTQDLSESLSPSWCIFAVFRPAGRRQVAAGSGPARGATQRQTSNPSDCPKRMTRIVGRLTADVAPHAHLGALPGALAFDRPGSPDRPGQCRRLQALNVTDAARSGLIALTARPKTAQALAARARVIPTCNEIDSRRHGPACPGHLYQQVPRQVARTRRTMAMAGAGTAKPLQAGIILACAEGLENRAIGQQNRADPELAGKAPALACPPQPDKQLPAEPG